MKICQSCGMKMVDSKYYGKNGDGSCNEEYCCYCYPNGAFSKDETLEEMVESCIPFSLKASEYQDTESARKGLLAELSALKRWRDR